MVAYVSAMFAFAVFRTAVREFNPDISCGVYFAIGFALLLFFNVLLLFRCWLLYVDFVVNRDSQKILNKRRRKTRLLLKQSMRKFDVEEDDDDDFNRVAFEKLQIPEDTWWFRNRAWFNQKKKLRTLIALVYVIIALPPVLVCLTVGGTFSRNDSNCNQKSQISNVVFLSTYSINSVALIASLLSLRSLVQETLGLKQELTRTIIAMVISTISQIVLVVRTDIENDFANVFGFYGYQVIEMVLPTTYIIYQTFYIPFLNSGGTFSTSTLFQDNLPAEKRNNPGEQTLTSEALIGTDAMRELLKDREFSKLFQEFLTLELNAHNLLFFKDVESYKQRRLSGREINGLYLSENAPLRIRLQQSTRKQIQSCFYTANEKLPPRNISVENVALELSNSVPASQASFTDESLIRKDLQQDKDRAAFDQAQEEVLKILIQDGFCRFRMTDAYRDWKKMRASRASRHRATNQSRDYSNRTPDSISSSFKFQTTFNTPMLEKSKEKTLHGFNTAACDRSEAI